MTNLPAVIPTNIIPFPGRVYYPNADMVDAALDRMSTGQLPEVAMMATRALKKHLDGPDAAHSAQAILDAAYMAFEALRRLLEETC